MSTTGTVTRDGSPVAGAKVFVRRRDDPDHTTDAQGQYDVGSLPAGTYLITVEEGGNTQTNEYVVESSGAGGLVLTAPSSASQSSPLDLSVTHEGEGEVSRIEYWIEPN